MNLMTKREIAEFLNVSTMTVDRYEKAGMPVLRPPMGGDPKYDKDDIVDWMKSEKVEG